MLCGEMWSVLLQFSFIMLKEEFIAVYYLCEHCPGFVNVFNSLMQKLLCFHLFPSFGWSQQKPKFQFPNFILFFGSLSILRKYSISIWRSLKCPHGNSWCNQNNERLNFNFHIEFSFSDFSVSVVIKMLPIRWSSSSLYENEKRYKFANENDIYIHISPWLLDYVYYELILSLKFR